MFCYRAGSCISCVLAGAAGAKGIDLFGAPSGAVRYWPARPAAPAIAAAPRPVLTGFLVNIFDPALPTTGEGIPPAITGAASCGLVGGNLNGVVT